MENAKSKKEDQISLAIVFTASTLHGETVGTASWLFHADDAWNWLSERKNFFPKASSQELVSLAVLPEDAQDQIVEKLLGLRPGSASNTAGSDLCMKPSFSKFAKGCALCVVACCVMGKKEQKAFELALFVFEEQMMKALPKAVRLPDGIFNRVSKEDAVAQMMSFRDKLLLNKQVPYGQDLFGPKAPRL